MFKAIQPDGKTKIDVRKKGDESLNWHEVDGYAVVKDKETGWWYYAEKDTATKNLKKSTYKAGIHNPSGYNLKKGLRPELSCEEVPPAYKQFDTASPDFEPVYSPPLMPHEQNILVILVDFKRTQGKYRPSSFRKMIFSGSIRSIKTYYNEVSYSNFIITAAKESYGTRNDGVIGWLRLGLANPDCYSQSDPETCYRTLAFNAISGANRFIKYSAYDANGDGFIDPAELAIVIVVAGYEEAYGCRRSSPSVWAHRWYLSTPVKADGKFIYDYAMVGEKHCDHRATLGIIAHELGHLILDLPDLYDTDGGSEGVGDFDLMGTGSWGFSNRDSYMGQTPVHPSAWSKMYAGFASASILNNQAGVLFPATALNRDSILKITTKAEKEYFLLENRYFAGYDAGLQGLLEANPQANGGLAIWHIDEQLLDNWCITWRNCNADEKHKLVDLEEAHGPQELDMQANRGVVTDLYYAGNNSNFSDITNPDSRLYSGASAGVLVNNVSVLGPLMSADIGKIPASITLISPKSGEVLTAGQSTTISWSYTGDPGKIRIELYRERALVSTIVTGTTVGTHGNGSWNWSMPPALLSGSAYHIKITGTTAINGLYANDTSGDFTINGSTIIVTSPNGGENWSAGEARTISWTYTGNPGNVRIELFNGVTSNKVVIVSNMTVGLGGNGKYNWTIPNTQATGDYRIKVTGLGFNATCDNSDDDFNITGPTTALLLPNGG